MSACQYMEQHNSPDHADILVSLLDDPDISVVRAALQALGTCPSLPDETRVKRFLLSAEKNLRVAAAVSLARAGSASGAAALERLSYDPDQSVRQQVATAIGQLGDPIYVSTLIRLLEGGPSVRRAALDALPRLVDPPFAPEPTSTVRTPDTLARQWKDWYRQQGHRPLMR